MKTKIEKGKHYKIKVNLAGRIEQYHGHVLSCDTEEFRFETEDDNVLGVVMNDNKGLYIACPALPTLRKGKD